ncbi:response regulator transcription factor [candidate division WOR-3 bacterium]|nr:response regulator transcription factor [candidate division WOR-3 bacterium]
MVWITDVADTASVGAYHMYRCFILDKDSKYSIITRIMIILVEPDKEIRKNLADLISRERLIGVASIQEALQLFLKFKKDLDLVIANVNLLSEMLSKTIIERVCQKLAINIPPVIAIYKESEEEAKNVFTSLYKGYKLIKYADNDLGFPNRYLEVIKKACPGLVIDYEKARESWVKKQKPGDFVDPRTWLEEEGFLEATRAKETESAEKGPDDALSSIQAMLHDETEAAVEPMKKQPAENYEEMYFDIKEKYDKLLKNTKTFLESITKDHT